MTSRPILRDLLGLLALSAGVSSILHSAGQLDSFKEGAAMTWLSFLLLLGIALVSLGILGARGGVRSLIGQRHSNYIWLVMAAGFVFLGIDEIVELHEGFDKFIHRIFEINETAVTDRLDDAIAAVYAIVGLGVVYLFKNEFFKPIGVRNWFVLGFIFVLISVSLDIFTNRSDLVRWLFNDLHLSTQKIIFDWLNIEEDVAKLFAEALFLAGFFKIFKASRPG
jgi:hypothetical protein